MSVVYPDGSPRMRSMLDPAQVAALPGFRMYDDAPGNPGEVVARLKDAWAMVLGWGRITDGVLAACPALKLISFTVTDRRARARGRDAARHIDRT